MHHRPSPKPRRRHLFGAAVAALALIAAACGGESGGSDTTVVPEPPATTAVAGTEAPAGGDGGVNTVLPDIPLESFDDGSLVTLDDFTGTPMVVNFWASWCPSCVAEMSAAFKPVEQDLGDRVTFIGVNIQDDRDKALELLAETGVDWNSVENEDGSLWTELGGLAMPFTVFIDENGNVVDKHNGPLNESLLRDRIDEHLLG